MTKLLYWQEGYGTRLSEYTVNIPKPMVSIGGIPMIEHIMNYYSYYGFNDFIICLGYKQEIIKKFFINFNTMNNDICIDLENNSSKLISNSRKIGKLI